MRGLRSPGETTHRWRLCSSGWHLAARIWGMIWGQLLLSLFLLSRMSAHPGAITRQ